MLNEQFYRMRVRFLELMVSKLEFGSLDITLPDGKKISVKGPQPGPAADMQLHDRAAVVALVSEGKMGFFEAYMAGQASSYDTTALIELAVMHLDYLESKLKLGPLKAIFNKIQHWMNQNSKAGSKKNISYHYDLGNPFYETWLDPTMTYSSAVYADEQTCLQDAQTEKYKRLADLAEIQPGDRVLEIGCGWGGFAEYAASQRGAHVTGITISKEQYDYCNERLERAQLSQMTDIQLTDYRDLTQKFDKIVSIEMFEAVGEKYWPVYFDKRSQSLKKGGKAALQVITIDDSQFDSYRATPDFIQKYIFPGGMLPSMSALEAPLQQSGLELTTANGYGLHYARTLAEWRDRFLAAWPELSQTTSFDERFKRMWELYLSYCEGGFKRGLIDVKQMLITHRGHA